MATTITFAIGDIHGCLHKLKRLMRVCEDYAGARPARYVFLGDYLDRGPHSRGVVAFLMRRQQDAQPGAVVCLMGNHEELAIRAQDRNDAVDIWLKNGGGRTRASYWRSGGRITPHHLAWLRALPLFYDDGLRFFVHAGVDPDVSLDRQRDEVMLWIRDPFLSASGRIGNRFIVHGHTPLGHNPELTAHRVNLDTGAVIGGPLTAAIFDDAHAAPIGFLTDRDAPRWWSRKTAAPRAGMS